MNQPEKSDKAHIKAEELEILNSIEKSIGGKIRARRTELGLTQAQLASKLNLSYQQIQKYETGLNRISAGRLYLIAKILYTNLSYFFDPPGALKTGQGTLKIPTVHLKSKILDQEVQRAIANLVSTMAKNIH